MRSNLVFRVRIRDGLNTNFNHRFKTDRRGLGKDTRTDLAEGNEDR